MPVAIARDRYKKHDKPSRASRRQASSSARSMESSELATIESLLTKQPPPSQWSGEDAEKAAGSNAPWYASSTRFDGLPISQRTKSALESAGFKHMTAIQRAAIPHALVGRDILGAAKTGSGKTLTFVIPLLERLWRNKWSAKDGLGAIIISPTRELATQIFGELRKAGAKHDISGGVLIGGKDVEEEARAVHAMNVLVCTPGRLLQHMDESPGFDATNVQVLVLDEADRLMDLGFQRTLDAIVQNLPSKNRSGRQTMLFSATQTRKVEHLARLSLRDPEYIAVHAESTSATPAGLKQALCVTPLGDKTSVCWSFLRSHLKSRILVFLSSCKQVQFYYETFRKLQPGIPLRCLHGSMSQARRLAAYEDFVRHKPATGGESSGLGMALFCTDVAARGLDFPRVQWVLQMDCPTDVDEYIHRVGRTARNRTKGRSLLCCTPEEFTAFHGDLVARKVPVELVKIKANKAESIAPALAALLSKQVEMKELAKKALVSYLKSLYVHKNRRVFPVELVQSVDLGTFAASYGLAVAPKVSFLNGGRSAPQLAEDKKGKAKAKAKTAMEEEEEDDDDDDDDDEEEEEEEEEEGEEDGDDDWLRVRRADHALDEGSSEDELGDHAMPVSGKKRKRKKLKLNTLGASTRMMNQKLVFDDDGAKPLEEALFERPRHYAFDDAGTSTEVARSEAASVVASHASRARALLAEADDEDKAREKEKRRQARLEKRAKFKASLAGEVGGGIAMIGGGPAEDPDDDDADGGDVAYDEDNTDVRDRRSMRWKTHRI